MSEKRVISIDFGSEEFVRSVCFAAKGGNRWARDQVAQWRVQRKHLDLLDGIEDGKFKRSQGRPRGWLTREGERAIRRRLIFEDQIAQARRDGSKKPVYEGAVRTSKYLKRKCGINCTVEQLLGERRRGRKKKRQHAASAQ